MTFSRGLLQEIKKCVEIRCWSLAPSNSLGPFSTEKKASASSLFWPANYFFHPWVHLPYLPGEEGGGERYSLWPVPRGSARKGCLSQASGI